MNSLAKIVHPKIKILAFATAILVSTLLPGQDNTNPVISKPAHKLSLGATFSPDFCYRTLIYTGDDPSANNALRRLNQLDRPKFGYTCGVVINYAFKKNIGIESGILVSNKGFKSRQPFSNLRFPDQIDPDSGFVKPTAEPNDAEELIIKYNYLYLDIPVRLVCNMDLKKFKIISSCGLVTNVLLKANEARTIKYKDGHKDKGSPAVNFLYTYNPVNLSLLLSAGIEYKLSTTMTMRVEPTLRYGMISITNTSVKGYLWNAGLSMGCYYTVK